MLRFLIALHLALLAPLGLYADDKVDFGRDVLPILSDNCFHCHGPDANNRKAKLRLDDEASAKKTVIVPGKSGESEAYLRMIAGDPHELMPPPQSNRKASSQQIATIKRWIDEGAVWGTHWAFTKVTMPPVPAKGKFNARVKNPIDAFVFARLEKEGLSPSPPATREAILRRVKLDLTGLPPTLAEINAFRADTSPKAYEKMVQRFLESPGFGERMAWDWLEAARYADSNGYQGDGERTMWPWRDWVVRAFNANVPFDRFSVEQLAGDLLPNADVEQKLATGFARNHMINGEGGRIAEENRIEYVMDMTETMGTVWLGLTLNCCRCHDHKYDPLAQADYYRLFGFFNQTPVNGGGGSPQTEPVLNLASPIQKEQLAKLVDEVKIAADAVEVVESKLFPRPAGKQADASEAAAKLTQAIKNILALAPASRGPTQVQTLKKELPKDEAHLKTLTRLEKALIARNTFSGTFPRVMVMEEIKTPRKTFVLDKGLYNKPKEAVATNVLTQFAPLPRDAAMNRLGLAQWLVSADNPLPARVTVNRLWQQFFGIGLVKSTEDLGHQSEKPSHPELLDWLSAEFIRSGWDVQHLVRLIVTSETYRQSSKASATSLERDPQNRLLGRGPRFRMPSWMIRDQALAASGLLVDKLGGPPVNPYQPPGVWEEATFGNKRYTQGKGEDLYRRSLYVFWRRIIGPTMFFDSATRQTCSVKASRTNTPLHALATLNDITYVEAARALAERVMLDENDAEKRLDLAFRRVLSRSPTTAESSILLRGYERTRSQFASDPAAAMKLLSIGESKRDAKLDAAEHAAFTVVCNTIFNLDEALTKD